MIFLPPKPSGWDITPTPLTQSFGQTLHIDPRGAELLFQVITEREERASVAIATNLPFSEWGTVFPDPRLVAAIVDRVTFNAHILATGTQSYRLRTSKTTTRRAR